VFVANEVLMRLPHVTNELEAFMLKAHTVVINIGVILHAQPITKLNESCCLYFTHLHTFAQVSLAASICLAVASDSFAASPFCR